MSLEDAILANTIAIEKLVVALTTAAGAAPATKKPEPKTELKTEAKQSSGSTKTEAESAAPSDTGASTEGAEAKPLDYKTLAKAFVTLLEKDREAAIVLLRELGLRDPGEKGGEKLSDLEPVRWPEALCLIEAAIAAN